MKFRPQFSLRTLFVLVALASVLCAGALAWRQSVLDRIRQRHKFLQASDVSSEINPPNDPNIIHYDETFYHNAPWELRLYGEKSYYWIGVPTSSKATEARELFPEAIIQDQSAP